MSKSQTNMPTVQDMQTSLEDARFFYEKIAELTGGAEQDQDLEEIRRYFRAYLHCWKCVVDFVREVKGLQKTKAWKTWCGKFTPHLRAGEPEIFHWLRESRDYDTHKGLIQAERVMAGGLFPIVMFQPEGKEEFMPSEPKELPQCCERGLEIADKLIQLHTTIP